MCEHFCFFVLKFISKVSNQAVVVCRHCFKFLGELTNGFLMGCHMFHQRALVYFNLNELMHFFSRSWQDGRQVLLCH